MKILARNKKGRGCQVHSRGGADFGQEGGAPPCPPKHMLQVIEKAKKKYQYVFIEHRMLLPSLVQGQFVSSVKLQPMIKYESSMHGFFYTGGMALSCKLFNCYKSSS